MDLMLKIAGWTVLTVYTVRIVVRSMRESYKRGIAQGFTVGYSLASDRVRTAIQHANDVALLAESMDDGMDARQYTSVLQESLIVTMGIHDAEREGLL